MKSASIVFTGPRQAEVRQEETSEAGPGQMVVQTRVSLMSTGTESWCFRGEFDADTGWANWVQYPFHPGYSNVGEVVQVGAGVTGFAEGDRVFSTSNHRQFVNLPVEHGHLVRIPDGITDEAAAWCKLATIAQTGVRHGKHVMGDTAVVVGLGPLGQLAVQYLRVLGLREVLAVDTAAQRLAMAAEHGATHTFEGGADDAVEFVKEHTGGQLADVVYDVTGHFAVFPLAQKLVRNFGSLVLLGDSPHPSKQRLTPDVLTRQLRIRGTHNEKLPPAHAAWTPIRQSELFFTYLERGQMRTGDLVTHRHAPADAPGVYEQLQRDRSGTMGIVFDWR